MQTHNQQVVALRERDKRATHREFLQKFKRAASFSLGQFKRLALVLRTKTAKLRPGQPRLLNGTPTCKRKAHSECRVTHAQGG
jgi:hypothetical protein